MQTKFNLAADDGKVVYGTHDSGGETDSVLVLVHGYTGSQDEAHYYNAVPFFNSRGIDTIRFDLYNKAVDARSLTQVSLDDHCSDLRLVLDEFAPKYKHVYVAGHSLGGLVVIQSDLQGVDRVVLWDPTTPYKTIAEKKGEVVSFSDNYLIHNRVDFLASKKLMDQWRDADYNQLVPALLIPTKIVFAGANNKQELWQPYLPLLECDHELAYVEGASHCFTEPGTMEKLFEETWQWIKNQTSEV